MGNLYTAKSFVYENGQLTLTLEGVGIRYVQGLKLVALTEFNGKNTFMFRDRERKRTNIEIEGTLGASDAWFELIGKRKLVLKDYAHESLEIEYADSVYELAESVIKTIQHLNILDGTAKTSEQRQQELKENFRLAEMKRRAGFLE